MTGAPRLVTTLGLSMKIERALMKYGMFSVEQLQKAGPDRIKSVPRVGAPGLRSLKRQLKKAGMDLTVSRPLGRKVPNRQQEIERLYLAGESLQSIGDIFGLTRERVRQIVNTIFTPETLEQAKQQHFQNHVASPSSRTTTVNYLIGIAENCATQAIFIEDTGIPRDTLVKMLPEVAAVFKSRHIRKPDPAVRATEAPQNP